MDEDKQERETDDGAKVRRVCEAPGQRGEEQEEREEIGKGGVGSVPGIFRF